MLDFTLDIEQEMLQDTARRFAKERVRKVYRDAEEEGKVPAAVVGAGWELGLLQSGLPEQYGGFGDYSAVTSAVAVEELAWGDLAIALHILSPNLLAVPVLLCGTERQKDRYLPLFDAMAPPSVSAALTEKRVKFDPFNLETTAEKDGDGYVLNGAKAMVPLADDAETVLIYASYQGKTEAFLAPRGVEGLSITGREHVMGVNALPLYGIKLDDVRLAAEQRLGGEEGIDFERILNHSRLALGAAAVGVARAGYEYALAYAKQRVQFGEPIAHRQSIAFMLADMAIDVDAARLLVWEAAWKLDKGESITRDATVMKYFVDNAVLQTADRALQVLGGYGYIREYPVELWLRNARGFAHFDGLAII